MVNLVILNLLLDRHVSVDEHSYSPHPPSVRRDSRAVTLKRVIPFDHRRASVPGIGMAINSDALLW